MKKFLLAIVWLSVLALAMYGCGSSSSSLGGGLGSLSGGASKAPISGGSIYVNGVDSGVDTDASGNFALPLSVLSAYSSGDYPLLIEIRGGTNTSDNTVYGATTVVLKGYMYEGDGTLYLSTMSTLIAQLVDSGSSITEAKAAVESLFNTIAGLMGMSYTGIGYTSNPTASDQFELVQQGLMSFLGVSEAGNSNIGAAITAAFTTKGINNAAGITANLGTIATNVIQNRAQIIANAQTARGTTITTDTTLIVDKLVGVNVTGKVTAGGTLGTSALWVDMNDTTIDVIFDTADTAAKYAGAGSYDGTGGLVYLDVNLTAGTATTVCDSAGGITLSAPTASYLTMANATGNVNGANNITASFDFTGYTAAQMSALNGTELTFTFTADDDTTLTTTLTVVLFDSNTMAQITGVTLTAPVTQADFNFAAQGNAVNIDGLAVTGGLTGGAAALAATVAYDGNKDTIPNLYYARFLSPEGSKFNMSSPALLSRNIDLLFPTLGASPAAFSASTASNAYTGTWKVEINSGAMAVGKKTFKVEVRAKSDNALHASDTQDLYFVTTDSLPSIALIDTLKLGGNDPYQVAVDTAANPIDINANHFTANVETWGTLSGINGDCTGTTIKTATDTWTIWRQGGVKSGAGFRDSSATVWTDNQDMETAGWTFGLTAGTCVLDMQAPAGDLYKVYYVSGQYNRDKVFVRYQETASGDEHTVDSSTMTIEAR